MFACDACLRRAWLSLGSASTTSRRFTFQHLARTINPPLKFSRSHATLGSLRKGHHRHSLFEALKDKKRKVSVPKLKPSNPRSRSNARNAEAVENNRLRRLEPEAREKYLERAMIRESKYLLDPLKLAQSVVEKLRDHQLDEALALVRASEKSRDGEAVENIVSWNHIIDWLMSQDSPGEAWKVYNEMKKRGHKPDSHTYTIMLRGYRHNVKKPNAVQQAMSVYDSISAANSAVTPTTIHTNAVLSVCARAHDVDAIWKIAGRLPERGPGAPDHVTFTTILQGLNGEAQKRAIERGAREGVGFNPQPIFDQVIDDARKLWLDITARWRKGYLHVDEALVCAMGRLLMLSDDKKTQKDVLNLVHQTMNIAKMSQASDAEGEAQEADELEGDEQRPSSIDVPARIAPRSDSSSRQVSRSDSSVYATPGTNTLSMLIETATALRELRLGKYYWELLTSKDGPYKIVPDHQNIMAYLRLLRVSRASRAVLDVLRAPRPEEVNYKLMVRGTFIIAMSTCLRDKKNPNVFETASRIMDLMQESTEDMSGHESDGELGGQKLRFSPKVLRMYLQIALATTKGINGEALQKTKNGDLDFERDPSKNHTMRALRRLGPDIMNVRQMIKSYLIDIEQQASIQERTVRVKKLLEKRRITPYSTNENISDLVELLQTMIGAIDKIILVNEKLEDEGMGPLDKEILNECWLQKRKLSAFVSKYSNAVIEPRRPSEIRARRVNEQGHGLSGRRSREPDGDDLDAEATGQVDFADDDLIDPSVPAPSPRAKILSDIQSAQEKVLKKSEERGLSRRQKLELIKKENIRAQFPASMLREQETPRRVLMKQDTRAAARERTREMLESGSGERRVPVWKASESARKFSRATRSERREKEKEDRRHRREELDRAETAKRDRMQGQKETYRGWGGGFEDLAKNEGRNLGGKAGVIELGP
jgi:pentatricopeptide repeat protein